MMSYYAALKKDDKMKIKQMEKSIGWQIIPSTSDEYQEILPEIEALMKRFNTDKHDSDVQQAIDSLLEGLDQNIGPQV
jgi:hypothetical protein